MELKELLAEISYEIDGVIGNLKLMLIVLIKMLK